MNRRAHLCSLAGLLTGCAARSQQAASGVRLQARPTGAAGESEAGTHPLGLRSSRDAILYVPKSAAPERPVPLLVYLHGATGSAEQGVRRLGALADEAGFLLLSPSSSDGTWDAIRDGYGPDVRVIDQALGLVFRMRRVDPRRIAVCGFSDGASYALGLGLSNGELFRSVMAFSPGFIPPGAAFNGKPRIFISHGTADAILPIDSCSRRLVPQLRGAGYEVNYREFEGPHTLPPAIAKEAIGWYLR